MGIEFKVMTSSERRSFIEKWLIPTGLCLTLFMVGFNVGLIQAIMPSIVRDLDSSVGAVLNTLVLFSLVTASFTPTSENVSLTYGRKAVFLSALVLYCIGLIITITSPNIIRFCFGYSLIMGLAAAPLVSTPWALIAEIYQTKQKEIALLVLLIFSIAGNLAGSLLGGLIASLSTWQIAFAPQLVILFLVFLLIRLADETPRVQNKPIDWIGGVLLVLSLGLFLMGISLSSEYGWLLPRQLFKVAGIVIPPFGLSITTILILFGFLFLGFFIFWLRQQASQEKILLLRVGLLSNRIFIIGLVIAILHAIVSSGIQFNLFQFIPTVPKLGIFETALAIIPYTLTSLVIMILTLNLSQYIASKYLIQGGLVIVSIGIWQLHQTISLEVKALDILPSLIIMGIGSGLVLGHIAPLTLSATQPEENAEASGIFNPLQDFGNSLGRALLGTLLFAQASHSIVSTIVEKLDPNISELEKQEAIFKLEEILQTFTDQEQDVFLRKFPTAVQQLLEVSILDAAVEGMKASLLLAFAISITCLIISFFLPKRAV